MPKTNAIVTPIIPYSIPRIIVPIKIAHNWTEFAIIKNLLFSSAKIFEYNITDIVVEITLREAICIGIIDSLNYVKKFSIKKGEKNIPDNVITIESRTKKIFNWVFFSPLTSLGSKYLNATEEKIIIIA